ncbi:hypothetical protein N665_1312s0004 [Sinapis alba]|nr:hypothetical protein N665_1312s0004 [Sinapis alba]
MANTVEQDSLYSSFVDARISFSNDFADSDHLKLHQTISSRQDQMKYKEAPVSSDFKFNVENYGFISAAADEIFFGGVLLPLEKTQTRKATTLREELSVQDSDRTISKGSRNWWKLGLSKPKKIHSKNNNNNSFHLPHKSQNCLASILESDD